MNEGRLRDREEERGGDGGVWGGKGSCRSND